MVLLFNYEIFFVSPPSTAASFVLGRTANGWEEWTDRDGCSLKTFYSQ
ncbi:DUF4357 domain-containing protein [Bacteroides pyogenes]|nr:DUF4357 domain-containing protein [Bacteroides pyogenes]